MAKEYCVIKNIKIICCIKFFILILFIFVYCSTPTNTPESETMNEEAETNAMILDGVHDPSNLIKIDNYIMLYASAVEWHYYDLDNKTWSFGGDNIYNDDFPDWYDHDEGWFWAPAIYKYKTDHYRLYHSAVEDEENGVSKIGFAESYGNAPELKWNKHNDYVLESKNFDQPFAIDPAIFMDDVNRLWLVYGSHGKGVYMVELDKDTGLLKDNPQNKIWDEDDYRFIHIADYGGNLEGEDNENNVEAAYIYNHPESSYYYLFVNWDRCCNGVDSTYNIRIGRSESPTGPYIDKDGKALSEGGGTLFLDTYGDILDNERFIGPGHVGIYYHENKDYYFSHHFYDKENNGSPSLAIWKLKWTNNWPTIDINAKVNFDY